jgi:hypothetical protein
MSFFESLHIFDQNKLIDAKSKDVISSRNKHYYVYSLAGDPDLRKQPTLPLIYTTFFPLLDGRIETRIWDPTNVQEEDKKQEVCFKLSQIVLPDFILNEEQYLFENIPTKKLFKVQQEDYQYLAEKQMPFAAFAFHSIELEGIDHLDYIRFAHTTSLPPSWAFNMAQQEIEYTLQQEHISANNIPRLMM